jgi:brefeldin A-resistance guanine nucleotide exchange factor 1
MADSGYLAPPEVKPEQRELWDQTWKRLDRFLPSLHGELFPDDVNPKGQKLPIHNKAQVVSAEPSPKNKESSKATVAEEKEAGKSS